MEASDAKFMDLIETNEKVLPNGAFIFSNQKFKLFEKSIIPKEALAKMFDEMGLSRWKRYLDEVDFIVLHNKGNLNIVTTCDGEAKYEKDDASDGEMKVEVEWTGDEWCEFASIINVKENSKGVLYVVFEEDKSKLLVVSAPN